MNEAAPIDVTMKAMTLLCVSGKLVTLNITLDYSIKPQQLNFYQ